MSGSSTPQPPSTRQHRARPAILGPLGRACFRHRRLTLITWIIGVACLITLWTRFGAPAQDSFAGSDPGQTLLNQHFHQQSGDTLTLAIRSNDPIGSPAVPTRITSALTPFARVHARRSPARIRPPARSRRTATWPSRSSSSACRPARSATGKLSR